MLNDFDGTLHFQWCLLYIIWARLLLVVVVQCVTLSHANIPFLVMIYAISLHQACKLFCVCMFVWNYISDHTYHCNVHFVCLHNHCSKPFSFIILILFCFKMEMAECRYRSEIIYLCYLFSDDCHRFLLKCVFFWLNSIIVYVKWFFNVHLQFLLYIHLVNN